MNWVWSLYDLSSIEYVVEFQYGHPISSLSHRRVGLPPGGLAGGPAGVAVGHGDVVAGDGLDVAHHLLYVGGGVGAAYGDVNVFQ